MVRAEARRNRTWYDDGVHHESRIEVCGSINLIFLLRALRANILSSLCPACMVVRSCDRYSRTVPG
jgi:hypothetical protein